MECVVLAGGRPAPDEPLFAETRGRQKADIEIAGRPMIAWVVDALRASRHIDRVLVVGLDRSTPLDGVVTRVPDQGSLVANLYAGFSELKGGGPAAYCWSDIPLATASIFDRFIDGVANPGLDVNAGLVAKSAMLARYPAAHDLWLRLTEGAFIAADFGVFHPRQAARLRPHLERLAPQRKSAWRQALYVGLPLLARFATGRLAIPQLERHLERRYQLRCRISVVADPELGLDVDSPRQLEICRQALAERHDTLVRSP